MKRLLPLLLALSMLLCACAAPGGETQPSSELPQPTGTTAVTDPLETTAPQETEPDVTEPDATEPVATESDPYVNPLTGEPLSEPCTNRPFTVSINNVKGAMPRHGVGQADILYEMLVEGGATRCLAVYMDITEVETIGSVRSARNNFIDLSRALGAVFIHAGGSAYANQEMKELNYDHINGLGGGTGDTFYRDSNRLNAGYAREHTLFSSGSKLLSLAQKRGFAVTQPEGADYGLQFSQDATPDGTAAGSITVKFGAYKKTTTMTYSADTGLYHGYQHDMDIVDGNTNEKEGYRNVFVMFADHKLVDGKYQFADLLGSGDGYFACGGQIVPIRWNHENADDPFTYTLTDGTPLVQGIGSSYVAIVPTGSRVTCE